MTWLYHQRTGHLDNPDGTLAGVGWAGHLEGRNNPAMQNVRGVGPLPVGLYTLGDATDDPHLGPCVMRLLPDRANQMFTRAGFFMHGASAAHPALSSDGCIVMEPDIRRAVADSDDDQLEVVAE